MNFTNPRFLILVFTIIVNSFLALVVYKNNPKNVTNKIFGALSLVTSLWLVDIYLSVTPEFIHNSLLWVRLSIFLASIQIMLFYYLADAMPYEKLQMKKRTYQSLVLVTLLVMGVAISPLVFTGVIIKDTQVEAVPGFGLPIFVLFAISLSFAAVYTLLRKLIHAKGYIKSQYRYVFLGLVLMLGLLIFTILIPVALFKNSRFVPFAPLYTIIFLGLTTVAIVRHRLFDIRTVIARSVAYLLVVSSFVATYTVAVLLVSFFVFNDGQINIKRHFTYIILALIFTPTVYWLKRRFDRITNKLFFQDAYDAQVVLDELSDVLVGNIELEKLLKGSDKVITNNLKVTYCSFGILDDSTEGDVRFLGANLAGDDKLNHFLKSTDLQKLQFVATEDLPHKFTDYHEVLRKHNIAVVVRLITHSGCLGYVLLGDKKSGNSYNRADTKLLTIISDELALAIQNALRFEEIQQFNITLQHKIDEATKALRHANDKLKALDEVKDEFISMASHQLRTPLTSVKGYVSMVLEGDAGKLSTMQKKLLDEAFISSQRMVYLIADLLNVSRLRTGKFVIEPKPTQLADLIEGEIAQLANTVKSKNLTFTFDKPKDFPLLMLDETKIRQVVMNFADNAVHYTPNNGHITVSLEDSPETIEFTVTDDGIGVPVAEQHHLFSKFYRADNAKKYRPDGTGLGLFMAKKVVVAQGGAVIFKSSEGKGSTFGFTFARSKLKPLPANAKHQTSNLL